MSRTSPARPVAPTKGGRGWFDHDAHYAASSTHRPKRWADWMHDRSLLPKRPPSPKAPLSDPEDSR